MPDLTIHISNIELRSKVVKAMQNEPYEVVMHLIVDLVENIAGDPGANQELKDLIEIINCYITEEE